MEFKRPLRFYFGSGDQELMMSPWDNATLISYILKIGAMINKND
jgi:hypothetical protein